jgi:hypothetical protein
MNKEQITHLVLNLVDFVIITLIVILYPAILSGLGTRLRLRVGFSFLLLLLVSAFKDCSGVPRMIDTRARCSDSDGVVVWEVLPKGVEVVEPWELPVDKGCTDLELVEILGGYTRETYLANLLVQIPGLYPPEGHPLQFA